MILLFCLLMVAHWLGDYTHLSLPEMLAAKKFGKPLFPIAAHAGVHALLVFFVVELVVGIHAAGFCFFIMLSTHFVIDVWKGKMNKWFPVLQDPSKYWHWWVFGADQTLHVIVIFLITVLATK